MKAGPRKGRLLLLVYGVRFANRSPVLRTQLADAMVFEAGRGAKKNRMVSRVDREASAGIAEMVAECSDTDAYRYHECERKVCVKNDFREMLHRFLPWRRVPTLSKHYVPSIGSSL